MFFSAGNFQAGPLLQQEGLPMTDQIKVFALAALLGAIVSFSASSAQAQAAAKPNPPPQICVNGQCATTSPSAPVATGSGKIKWNPGHYMASESTLYASKSVSGLNAEMNDLNNQDAILGYRIWVTWGVLEPTQGNYDFSALDSVLARLKTAYNKPKRLVIGLWLYGQNAIGSNDGSVVPMYIQQNSAYGPSPVAGRYGWWGKSVNGASTGMYAPALYNPAVMDRFIAVMQALGKHFDNDPYVEAIYVQEDATIAQAASAFKPVDPAYSDTAWLTQIERLLTAATAAWPTTSVIMANSWFDRPPSTVALTQWMANNRIAPGSADSWGQTGIDANGTTKLSDGIQLLLGTDQFGSLGDLRGKMSPMMDVQSAEMVGPYFSQYGGPWTPLDIIHAFNQTYYASHAFWTHFIGTEASYGAPIPTVAKWSNLAATCAANPLTHTAYPGNYP
jgi:hypothetical protein